MRKGEEKVKREGKREKKGRKEKKKIKKEKEKEKEKDKKGKRKRKRKRQKRKKKKKKKKKAFLRPLPLVTSPHPAPLAKPSVRPHTEVKWTPLFQKASLSVGPRGVSTRRSFRSFSTTLLAVAPKPCA